MRRNRGVSVKRGAPAKRILPERDLLVQDSNLTECAVRAKNTRNGPRIHPGFFFFSSALGRSDVLLGE